MKKALIIASLVLIVLLVGLLVLYLQKKERSSVSPVSSSPTPIATVLPTKKIFPESLLASPIQTGPKEDLNAYKNIPKDEQEFSTLAISLPLTTADYSMQFNFANSTFLVTIDTDKGMEEYQALRRKYPNIKGSLFIVTDKRTKK